MQHRGVALWHGLVFFCIASLFVLGLLVVPAGAQQSDPIADQTVFIEDNDRNGTVDALGPIAVADCTVARDATIVVEDAGGTQVELINGDNVTITGRPESITIEATDPETTFGDLDPGAGEAGRVISSTGIVCGGSGGTGGNGGTGGDNNGNAAETQYNTDGKEVTVIVNTIPDKRILVDTGGPSLPMIGGLVLTLGLVGLGTLLLRRT
jgi:hypothetical protein